MGLPWQARAACKGKTDLFFSNHECDEVCDESGKCEGERREKGRAERIRKAKEVCDGCPVKSQCKAWAFAVELPYGVAGGLTHQERKRARRMVKVESNGNGHRKPKKRLKKAISKKTAKKRSGKKKTAKKVTVKKTRRKRHGKKR